MVSEGKQFVQMMADLRQKYLAQLKERRPEIADFIQRCEQKTATAEDRRFMRDRAHSLAGSGATYGFPDISKTARTLEEAIDAGKGNDALLPLARVLHDACHHVLTVGTESKAPSVDIVTAAPVAGFGPRPKLLTVDDDPAVRDMMVNLFSNDAHVLTAGNGKEALEMIRKHRPDLVLLDDMMPEMSGMKLMETLQNDRALSSTAVVMLTASDRSQDVMRAISAGALDYVTKPFDPQALATKVRGFLARFGKTILIVEDDAAVRDLLIAKFHACGLRVVEAKDGEQGLKLAQKHRPQLAIVDRMMPGLDGMALLQKLKADADTKPIPVIFLTAKRHEHDIVEGLRLGAADYIVKPFSPEEVVARCLRILGLEAK